MQQIKDTIRAVLKELQQPDADAAGGYDKLLTRGFSKKELGHIKIKYLRKGLLGVAVDSSAWLYYFSLYKAARLKKLQLLDPQIKDVRFHVGDIGRD